MSKTTEKHHRSGFLILALFLLCSGLQAQSPKSVAGPAAQLQEYTARLPQEKVYLHTDRKHYAPGESLWFQAYVVAGVLHEPSPLSGGVYVSLFSREKQLIDQKLIRATTGVGHGTIELPKTLPAGSYVLRAYTNWMRNFSEDFFFEKEIVVATPDATAPMIASGESLDLQFFPEGGHLVADVATRIAFKALDPTGRSITVSGSVYDQDGNEVTKFDTQHRGMGMFSFTPKAGFRYSAKLTTGRDEYPLPAIEEQGFSMVVNNNLADVLRVTFRTNEQTKNKQNLGVIVHTRGAIRYTFALDLASNITFVNLPKAGLPAGISTITLFDQKGKALIERLVFVKKDGETVQLKTDQDSYGKREKVTATLTVTDTTGAPVKGAFSLSAIDLGQTIDKAPEETIVSNLLLTSDIKGYVEDPAYYFDPANPQAARHLDLLLMTQGWRRFAWSELGKIPETPEFGTEPSLTLKGKLLRVSTDKPAAGGSVTLMNQQVSPPWFLKANADNQGNFYFKDVVLYNNEQIVFQGENKKGRNLVEFRLDTIVDFLASNYNKPFPLPGVAEEAVLANFNEKSKLRDLIDESYNFDSTATLLETVVVEGNRQRAKEEEEERQSIFGKGDNTVRFEELESTAANNPLEMIQGMIAGVNVSGSGAQTTVNIRNSQTGAGAALEPLILLDDIAIDVASIVTFPANMIERVEVYKGPSAAVFGIRGAGGVLAFFSKKGGDFKLPDPVGVLTTRMANAYEQEIQFYAPKYDTKRPEHIKPDNRILLHWQPMILLDANGTAKIEFWNTDVSTEVLLHLEGITQAGTPLAKTIRFSTNSN